MKKQMSLRKQAQLAPKYVLKIDGVGYLSDEQGLRGVNITETVDNAMMFSVGFDNPKDKISIWNATARIYFENKYIEFKAVEL